MRSAFILLGVMTLVVSVGTFLVFSRKVDAPHDVNIMYNEQVSMKFTLSSPVFKEGESIPATFTCDGENINPELRIDNIPDGTKSLVLVMDDLDIPEAIKKERGIEKFDHWVLYNIPPDTTVLSPETDVGTTGLNAAQDASYRGPCPPDREHRYYFRLYALPHTLNFIKIPTLYDVEEAAKGSMIEMTTLMGRYERDK
jgi:Raf kinase inhibitor-like YbhB/YbcL family protein